MLVLESVLTLSNFLDYPDFPFARVGLLWSRCIDLVAFHTIVTMRDISPESTHGWMLLCFVRLSLDRFSHRREICVYNTRHLHSCKNKMRAGRHWTLRIFFPSKRVFFFFFCARSRACVRLRLFRAAQKWSMHEYTQGGGASSIHHRMCSYSTFSKATALP